MDRAELASRLDHTVLGPETTADDARRVLDEALEHGMNACVPPCYVAEVADYAPSVRLVTVVGFPHGQHAPQTKREEAIRAWDDGADELDVVINVGRLHAGDATAVEAELAEVVASVPVPVKAVLETALLDHEERHAAARAAADAGCAFCKTSTGFAGGATPAAVDLLSRYLPTKASGGIASWADVRTMLDAGAVRIGTSRGVEVLRDFDGWSPDGREG